MAWSYKPKKKFLPIVAICLGQFLRKEETILIKIQHIVP